MVPRRDFLRTPTHIPHAAAAAVKGMCFRSEVGLPSTLRTDPLILQKNQNHHFALI